MQLILGWIFVGNPIATAHITTIHGYAIAPATR